MHRLWNSATYTDVLLLLLLILFCLLMRQEHMETAIHHTSLKKKAQIQFYKSFRPTASPSTCQWQVLRTIAESGSN